MHLCPCFKRVIILIICSRPISACCVTAGNTLHGAATTRARGTTVITLISTCCYLLRLHNLRRLNKTRKQKMPCQFYRCLTYSTMCACCRRADSSSWARRTRSAVTAADGADCELGCPRDDAGHRPSSTLLLQQQLAMRTSLRVWSLCI